eukprot:6080440-Prymnesium_polylepis.1
MRAGPCSAELLGRSQAGAGPRHQLLKMRSETSAPNTSAPSWSAVEAPFLGLCQCMRPRVPGMGLKTIPASIGTDV